MSDFNDELKTLREARSEAKNVFDKIILGINNAKQISLK